MNEAISFEAGGDEARVTLVREVEQRAPLDAVQRLEDESDETIAAVLAHCDTSTSIAVLLRLPAQRAAAVRELAPDELRAQWSRNERHAEGSVGRLMDLPAATFRRDTVVAEAVEAVREISKTQLVTYGYVTDRESRLEGVVVMRDLLLATPGQTLAEIMVGDPFWLDAEMDVEEAMPLVLHRHYPVYPVCDAEARLVGIIRGHLLFEEQAFELSAQPGRMVGVEDEERVTTPWWRCLRLRHPWLQLNLLTAFVAASVVGYFQQTIDQLVLLAVFLPVMAGQSGNTGLQALAVTLRGMTLGDLDGRSGFSVAVKEGLVGLLNGALVGATAGLGMYIYARSLGHAEAPLLGLVVFLAMVGSCFLSGISGTLIPLGLRRVGVDPATASSIFLTTLTDLVSMGAFLWLATLMLI